MKTYCILILAFCSAFYAEAQQMNSASGLMEPIGFDYGLVPDMGENQLEKYNLYLMFGKPLKKGRLGFRADYSYANFQFENTNREVDVTSYEKTHNLRLNVFYLRELSKSWALNITVTPSIVSNFDRPISEDDLLFTGFLSVAKTWGDTEKFSRFTFGLGYSAAFGKPQILPMLSFFKKINANWSYSIGLPMTGVFHKLNERNYISFLVRPDGLFANNPNEVYFAKQNEVITNTKLQFISIKTGFEYKYRIQPDFNLVFSAGFIPFNELKIVDHNAEELFDFNVNSTYYISTGVRFNLNRKENEKKSN
ncbi:MAG: DUF6268 family outer membrane beta-barrel protein [Bacteroidota bacterium]